MADLADTLKKQVGPLPLGIWLAAIAGGLGLAYVIRRHNPLTAPAGSPAANQAAPTPETPAPASNDDWRLAAERGLINNGFDPLGATQAIEGYLSGATLSPDEQAIIEAALKQAGPAPQAPPPPLAGTIPTSYQTPPPQSPPTSTFGAPPPAIPAPANTYSVGQTVNAGSGERIVSSVFHPKYGWLNLTNLGGIYTGSPGADIRQLQYGGSYLGYAGTQKNVAGEVAAHGTFGPTGLAIDPNGGYKLTNINNETYAFG